MNNLPALIESELLPPDLAAEVDALCGTMELIVINDADTYSAAAESRKGCKAMARRLDTERKQHTAPLDDRKRDIMSLFQRPIDRLGQAEKVLGARMIVWDAAQQRARDEEQRRINEALARKAEEERKRAEEAAVKAMQEGKAELAERLIEKAADTQAPEIVLEAVKPTAKGVHYREVWSFEVTDFAALPDQYKIADSVQLGQIARSRHDEKQIPGVRFFSEKVLAQR